MDSTHELAADALLKISNLSRDVPYTDVKDLVHLVLSCPRTRLNLPILIVYLRNHAKSFAPGVGAGEKCIPLKLLCALYEEDSQIAIALLNDIANYGSWSSLLRLLELIDELGAGSTSEYNPSTNTQFNNLQRAIHVRFAAQLQADQVSEAAGSGVSNASKFAPHEGRGGFNSYHADRIASIIFSDTEVDVAAEKRKFRLRKLYRKLRAKLNAANGHIAEVHSLSLLFLAVKEILGKAPFPLHTMMTALYRCTCRNDDPKIYFQA